MADKEHLIDHSGEVFDSERDHDRIKNVNISDEMKTSFLDYSMSVIVSRALPDVKDGLKPVHRRILYAMNDLGMTYDKPHKKSARIVGDVIAKYHPHGDTAVYEAMARLAQDFSCRYPLVDGHGNFGSIDGDSPAAMRYTEARLAKISNEMVRDINKDTVDFIPNYDGEEKEPVVLPAKIPHLLINGSTGIAVGMATNIPPHNLSEVVDGILAITENPDISVTELITDYIHGPDFPTAGIVLGKSGIKKAYETGSGIIVLRSRCEIEDDPHHFGRKRIVVTEIPYQINKVSMIERIADLVKNKVIDGILDIRDESSREGIKVVIELKKEVIPEVLLNQLFKYSSLQVSYSINMLAILDGQPKIFSIKEMLNQYIDHQINVTRRKTKFDLDRALDRIHILEGLSIARKNLDEVIALIRSSKTTEDAQNGLIEKFQLSEKQAKAILEMRLQRLTGVEQEKIELEIVDLQAKIVDYRDILDNHDRVIQVIKEDLLEIKERYGDPRKTEISNDSSNIEDEELIPEEDVIYTLTAKGYIKRVPADTFRAQNRGGRGVKGITTNDGDVVEKLLFASTHTDILFFSNRGKVYRMRGYQIPEYARQGKGIPLVNLLPLDKEEKIKTIINIDESNEEESLMFFTVNGVVKRVAISEFKNINKSGKIAIILREGDEIYDVKKTAGNDEVYIGATSGKVCRFNEKDARQMGRSAAGVRGINISEDQKVIGVTTSQEGKYILVITSKGFGKMSDREDYRLTQRGGKGVISLNATERNGTLVAMRAVNGDEDLLITTTKGIIIRVSLDQVKIAGRNTQGVRIIKLDNGQDVASITVTTPEPEEETSAEETVEENKEA